MRACLPGADPQGSQEARGHLMWGLIPFSSGRTSTPVLSPPGCELTYHIFGSLPCLCSSSPFSVWLFLHSTEELFCRSGHSRKELHYILSLPGSVCGRRQDPPPPPCSWSGQPEGNFAFCISYRISTLPSRILTRFRWGVFSSFST